MPFILYTLFAASIMPLILAGIGGYFRVKQFGKFDNHHPRQQQAQLTGAGARIQGAQANSWEALIFYTATCFIAHASGLNLHTLDKIALLFISLRVLFAIAYIANWAAVRSLVFVAGILSCGYIVYLAATHGV